MTNTELLVMGGAIAAKGSIVLSFALAAGTLMRGRSAAARHLTYAIALLGASALVPLSAVVPAWHVPLFTRVGDVAPVAPTAPAREAGAGSSAPSVDITPTAPAYTEPRFSRDLPTASNEAFSATEWLRDHVAAIWAFGTLLVLGYHLFGTLSVARLRRRSRRITDVTLLAGTAGVARSLGIARPIAFYASDDATMPVTWGTLAPAVLLPSGWTQWTESRRRAVLEHELAHVARRDCAWQVVASLACAVHWFNPVAWMVASRLRAERERACDDLVLAAGVDACDYADHLLDVARCYRAPRATAAAAIAMARPSQLEGRLLAILDTRVARSAPTRARQRTAAALVGLLLMPTAAMRPWAEPAASPAASSEKTRPLFPITPTLGALKGELTPLPSLTDSLSWTRRMQRGQWLKVYTMKSDIIVEESPDADVHVITIFGADDGRGPRQHEFDEDERQIEVCPALPAGVKRVPVSGCWPVEWGEEVARDNAVRTVVRVPLGILVDVKTSTGDIVSTNAMVPIVAGSVDGSIRITTSDYATANTVNGDVDVTLLRTVWRGTIAMKTVSGRLAITLPKDADTDVELMNSTGRARTSFSLDRTWRGVQWRMHGAARLGQGGRKVSVEGWTGSITVRRDGENDSLPMRFSSNAGMDEDPNPNPNPDPGGDSPSYSPSPSPSPSARSRTRAEAINGVDPATIGANPYDKLPREYDALLDKPYVAEKGGVTGERLALDLPSGFLRKFARANLRGVRDSAAIAMLAQAATAQWLAYHLGDTDPGVELGGERALWALSRSTRSSLVKEVTHELGSYEWRTRAYAAWTLGTVDATSATDALLDALGDPMARVRAASAVALGQTHPAAARVPLERLLRDDDYQVRAAALDALSALGDTRSIAAVRPLLRDAHTMVRSEAEHAIQILSKR